MNDFPAVKSIQDIRVLVVDTQALVHEIIQSVLVDMGVDRVVCAQNAYHALRECESDNFDLVILAFNVSSDKDGFHLYEELRQYKHITDKTTVIFLSAETSPQLVNCVVEFQPHDFWVKPLSKSRVQQRLMHMLVARKTFHKLNCLLDNQDYAAAIYQIERLLDNVSMKEFHGKLKRLKGNCLMRLFVYDEAEQYYQELISSVDTGWANVGLLHCLLTQGKNEQAEYLSKQLIERDDTRFATYDLLAQHHINNSEYDQAYKMMQRACELAPRNMNRNKKLWDLARLNHDRQGQLKAVRSMEKYAKNSIHDSPLLCINVLRSSIDLASTLSGEESGRLINKAQAMLSHLQESYRSDKTLQEILVVVQARIAALKENKTYAESLIEQHKVNHRINNVEDGLDKMKVFHELGMHEQCMKVLAGLKQFVAGDAFSSSVVAAYLQQESIERAEIKFSTKELKQMAASHYQNGRLEAALDLLTQASVLSPADTSLSLSLLKVLAQLTERQMLSDPQLDIAAKAKAILDEANLSPSQQQKCSQYTQSIFTKQ